MARPKNETLHQERRLQVLKAAAGVFRAKGFHAARTEEICSAAGMSAGTVFRYFRDKEEIIATIAEMEFNASQEMGAHMFTREGFTAFASIDGKGLEEMRGSCASGMGLGLDSWLELYRNEKLGEQCKAKERAMREQFADALRLGQAEGWVRAAIDPNEAVSILMALFSGLMMEQQIAPGLDLEKLAGGLRGVLRAYILTEA